MLYLYEIKKLYDSMDDFNLSPFDAIENLHIRSEMNEVSQFLTKEEKKELENCDCKMLENAAVLLKHLQGSYDFKNSKQPIEEWWWHLDKVVSGELVIHVALETT